MPVVQQGINISDSAQVNPGVITSSDIADDTILNEDINSAAAIAQSKLALSITNNEVNASAAIVDTKLAQITTASKVDGAALTGLASIPAGAGVVPAANLPSTSLVPTLNIKLPEDALATSQAKMGADQSQTTPTYLWFATWNGTTAINIYQLERQGSGNYTYKGVTATITTTTSNKVQGITEMGSKVYVWYENNGSILLHQFTTALASETNITGFSSAGDAQHDMSSSSGGTKLWVTDGVTAVKSYTVSGTAATLVDNITLSVSQGTTNHSLHIASNGDIYSLVNRATDTVPNLIQRYNSSGTAQTDVTCALFSGVSAIEFGMGFIKIQGYVAYAVAQKLDGSAPWWCKIQSFDLP